MHARMLGHADETVDDTQQFVYAVDDAFRLGPPHIERACVTKISNSFVHIHNGGHAFDYASRIPIADACFDEISASKAYIKKINQSLKRARHEVTRELKALQDAEKLAEKTMKQSKKV